MKCDYCPLAPFDDVCPESEGKYGIEFKDGSLGCKHPRNWVEKRDFCGQKFDWGDNSDKN